MMGNYDPQKPVVVPTREDKRYRSWRTTPMPQSNAVMIFIMDVSGSMGDEQKEIVRIASFWIDTWLRSQYKGLESRFIIHDEDFPDGFHSVLCIILSSIQQSKRSSSIRVSTRGRRVLARRCFATLSMTEGGRRVSFFTLSP